MIRRLVVVGAGMAAGTLLEEFHRLAPPGRWQVTLFGAEPEGIYDRIQLTPVLAGEKDAAAIVTHDAAKLAQLGVEARFGEPVLRIDRTTRRVIAAGGPVAYDRLVLATGSQPWIPPLAGADLPGVFTFRDLADVRRILGNARPGGRAVVVGGGLLGLEAAAALAGRGLAVTVLHLAGHLMERQLDASAGFLLKRALEGRGIRVRTGVQTRAVLGHGRVEAVLLEGGTVVDTDLVVLGTGIRPATGLAVEAGLRVERGIVVDDAMRTSDPDILAIGECAEHAGTLYGLVAPVHAMARVAARTLLDLGARFVPPPPVTRLKVTGIDVFTAGRFDDGDHEDIVLRDPARGVYRRIAIRDGRIVGILLYGDTADAPWFLGHMQSGADVTPVRDRLVFGPAAAETGDGGRSAAVAALPDDAEICGCNGVCKGTILAAIAAGAHDLAAVRAKTRASASCGSCSGLVGQLLTLALGRDVREPDVRPVCGCTDLDHAALRRLIQSRGLRSIPEVMQACGWRTPDGCHVCRPALNYYLLAEWPLDYEDDPQSRFVNERVHANIQKDGTFSVVPRIWGGVTTAAQLRAIADVCERHAVPMVKLTGGQRIDLLGVRKEQLPDIWADLAAAGLVSGHAYGKAIRTVKTCVGSDFCRFGTQDSIGLGIALEKVLWGSWTPHKVKLAVSGCPRNCAEATCKDVGVVCTEGGFEIGIGGAAGLEVKKTETLARVASAEEVVAIVCAVVQLYRETGFYLERMYRWLARVGLDRVRAQVVEDAENRRRLVERFELSQQRHRRDPWAELVASADLRRKWVPLAAEAAE